MLQEPPVSKGPRVPTSILSTSDSIAGATSTLMRMSLDHGSPEFSDLEMTDVRTGHAWTGHARTGRTGHAWTGRIGRY